jgi:hypothetical protein
MSQQKDCKSTIERAFEIAGSGEAATMERLGRILAGEGYSLNMLAGPILIKQLRQKMIAGQKPQIAP